MTNLFEIQDVRNYLITIYHNDNNNAVFDTYNNYKNTDYIKDTKENFENIILQDNDFLNMLLNDEGTQNQMLSELCIDTDYEKIASYIFATCILNSYSGTYGVSIEDVESTFDIKINYSTYNRINEVIWELYGDKLIDINNDDDYYYYVEQKEFNLNIYGMYCLNYIDDESEDE